MKIEDALFKIIINIFRADANCTFLSNKEIRKLLKVDVLRYNSAIDKILKPIQKLLPHSILIQKQGDASVLYIIISNIKLPDNMKRSGLNRVQLKARLEENKYRVL